MSYQEPIFNSESGLFGRANRFVVNSWVDASRATNAYAEGMDWAQRQVVQAGMNRTWLAKLTAATLIGPNRWRYAFSAFNITAGFLPQLTPTTFGQGVDAVNIRELRNTAAQVDGSPIPNGASVGPVGSSWSAQNVAWNTTDLEGYVWMHASYTPTGTTLFWFDTPNPVRCAASFFTEGEGEGGPE